MTAHPQKSKPTFITENNEERANYIESQLTQFNNLRASPLWQDQQYTGESLQIYSLDENGIVIGGLVGRTNDIPEWLQISDLWIMENKRKQGLGSQLMRLAEEEAKRRRCCFARLTTSDYQAPNFYEKLGYKVYGKLENCPRGETVYFFFKELA